MNRKALLAGVIASALTTPAFAATVTLGGVEIPGQGLFSLEPVDFTETFDHGGACGLSMFSNFDFANATADPAQVQSWIDNPSPNGSPMAAIVSGSSPGRHKAPSSNASCYLAVLDETIEFLFPFVEFEYIGFHWSSIDEYNMFSGLDDWPIEFEGFGDSIEGSEIWSTFGVAAYGDQYVNIALADGEAYGVVLESIGNWAFEIDNISFRFRSDGIAPASVFARTAPTVADVPAPGALALFGLGAMVLAARQRRGI